MRSRYPIFQKKRQFSKPKKTLNATSFSGANIYREACRKSVFGGGYYKKFEERPARVLVRFEGKQKEIYSCAR